MAGAEAAMVVHPAPVESDRGEMAVVVTLMATTVTGAFDGISAPCNNSHRA